MAGGGRYVARTAADQVYIYCIIHSLLGRQVLISLKVSGRTRGGLQLDAERIVSYAPLVYCRGSFQKRL